jgi:hypothetical protein
MLRINYKLQCYIVFDFSCKILDLQKQATHITWEAGKLPQYHGVASYSTEDRCDTSNCLSLSMD